MENNERQNRSSHKQVKTNYMGTTIEVDRKIEHILRILWDNEIKTYNSCEDNFGKVWIEFAHLSDFKNMVRKSFLRKQLISIPYAKEVELMPLYEFFESLCRINLNFQDNSYPDENDGYWNEGDDIFFSVSLRFDKELLNEFTESIQELYAPKHELKIK